MDNPSHTGILQDVQNVLNEHGVSVVSFIINTLQDQRLLFAKDLTMRIVNILDTLHPHPNKESIMEFRQFFASVASSVRNIFPDLLLIRRISEGVGEDRRGNG